MLCALPDIHPDRVAWRIPFWPRTALRLVEALSGARHRAALRSVLEEDPSLVLWTLLLAGRSRAAPFRSLAEVARWFERRAVAQIVAAGRRPQSVPSGQYADQVAQWNARARWLALAARGQARELGPSEQRRAELLGSVWLVPQWPEPTEPVGEAEAPVDLLPPWLSDLLDGNGPPEWEPAVAAVRRAAEEIQPAESDRLAVPASPLPAQRTYALVFPALRQWQRYRELRADYKRRLEREKLQSLYQFAYGAGHEINNPLTNITLRADSLLRGEADPRRIRMLETIRAQAYRAYHMIADMMLYAKPPDLQMAPTSLAAVLQKVVADVMPLAAERQIQFGLRGQAVGVEVIADAAHLAVAVRAVVQNALEAVQRGGRVTLVVTSTGSQALICCQDSGPGLSAEARRHLFDPFYSGREAGRGLGFGLCKAWRIVTLHGGWIQADSGPGEGTTVRIGLPLAPAAAPPRTVLAPAEVPFRGEGAIRPSVLRIDDPDAA